MKKYLGSLMWMLSICFLASYPILAKILQWYGIASYTIAAVGQLFWIITIFLTFWIVQEWKHIFQLWTKKFSILLLVGLLTWVGGPLLLLTWLEHTTATTAILVGRIEPIMVSLLAIIWLKESRNFQRLMSGIVMLVWVLFLITEWYSVHLQADIWVLYIVWSALCASFGTILFKKYLSHIDPDTMLLWRNMLGAVILLWVVPFVTTEVHHQREAVLQKEVLWLFVLFATITIFGAQLLWYKSLEKVSAKQLSLISLLLPFVGVLFSVVILQEELLRYHIIWWSIIIIWMIGTHLHIRKSSISHLHLRWKHIRK